MSPSREFKILYLTPGVFDKGGISRYGRYQIRALRELAGDENVVVMSLHPPDGHGFESPFRVDLASTGANLRGRALFGVAAALEVVSSRPAIIWCAHAYMAPLALLLAKMSRARCILDVFGLEVWTDVGPLRARSIRAMDYIVSDCYATRDYVVDVGLHAGAKIAVHWDCVDVGRFCPGDPQDVLERYGVPADQGITTLGTLARLTRKDTYKGVDRLIDLMDQLPEDLPVRLVVGGDGDGRSLLEQRARGARQRSRIFFIGSVSEQDLPDFYRACDIFSLITTKGVGAGEGIPLTPLEAAACGKPILVGNQDGSREAAEHGKSGYVLDPLDQAAVVDVVAKLVRQPDLGRRVGAAGRERIISEHSYERFRMRTSELLRGLGLPVHGSHETAGPCETGQSESGSVADATGAG